MNFNQDATTRLGIFATAVKEQLMGAPVAHADETGINVGGRRLWLHNGSSDLWTWFKAHEKRGTSAMNEIGILPNFKGMLGHDHWKPYFTYTCTHSLCNAHHLRELIDAHEEEGQSWALTMKRFLTDLNNTVGAAGGLLEPSQQDLWRTCYREILD